ncbi:SUF system Fe-S cluster assembly regulator [Kordiimonas sp. SCSIO 12610]|uniref:SUF system Fe-S cluster assembly regulator n=1 Tax=Kordiimonas sp. SCSIO 12610 TaxID=2829597 RepID=UPI00210ECB55|nr:SUF system Fe-S cluster assembly regulator [Kordiimonas sp. SCSIO 12610]UTW55310.1 SUF system Fe-S cluster assembly regulator [Kordiimonas sp. SCSIO 12610]
MIRLTNLADYAVVLMCEMARADAKVNAQSLSDITRVPNTTVAKILNLLTRSGLLISHRGLKGGFALAKDAKLISVADIIEAIDGPIAMTHCSEEQNSDCSFDEICVMRPHWQSINGAVRNALAGVKLSELIITPHNINFLNDQQITETSTG